MANKHAFVVNFTGEAEVYGPTALKNGLIVENFPASILIITNSGTSVITIGFGLEPIADYEGVPIAGGDGESPGGTFVFDLKSNNASTGKIRAKVLGGGAGKLSFLVL